MHRTGKRESTVTSRYGSASPRASQASSTSLEIRPRNSAKNEIIALMFNSMVHHVVKSWKTVEIKEGNDAKIILNQTLSDPGERKKTARTFLFILSSE